MEIHLIYFVNASMHLVDFIKKKYSSLHVFFLASSFLNQDINLIFRNVRRLT